jgi:hypothetical protein
MDSTAYSNNKGKARERSINDKRVVREFIEELDGEAAADRFLDSIEAETEVEATAEYRLHEAYSGDSFLRFATRGEEVEAQVNLYVQTEEPQGEFEYSGSLQSKATEIFHPKSIAETTDEDSSMDNSSASTPAATTD